MQVKIVDDSKLRNIIKDIKEQQKVMIAVKNAPLVVLEQLHRDTLKLVGTVDTLRGLGLLEDEQYQELVENNVIILDKLESRIVEVKRSLVVLGKPTRRTTNYSR